MNKKTFFLRKKSGIQKCYLNYLDMLMPYNGMFTVNQCVTISRILDIERFFEGRPFFWQRRLTILDGIEKLNHKELELLDTRFYDLLISLKEKGYDSNIDNIVISNHPIELLNGTHRLAWIALYEKSMQIPCVSVADYNIYPVDGLQWLKCINLPPKEILFIKERYDKLLTDNSYCLLVIACINIYPILIGEISKYFIISNEKRDLTISEEQKRKLMKSERRNNELSNIIEGRFCIFNLKLLNQLLMMENGKIISVVISALTRRLNLIDQLEGKYWIAHTISESIKIMSIIEY